MAKANYKRYDIASIFTDRKDENKKYFKKFGKIILFSDSKIPEDLTIKIDLGELAIYKEKPYVPKDSSENAIQEEVPY